MSDRRSKQTKDALQDGLRDKRRVPETAHSITPEQHKFFYDRLNKGHDENGPIHGRELGIHGQSSGISQAESLAHWHRRAAEHSAFSRAGHADLLVHERVTA